MTFEWVKGHAGHALNEAADDRARAAAAAFQRGAPVSAGPGWSPPGKDAAGPADTQLPTHTSTGGAAGSGAGENDPPANLTSPWAAAASELEETVPDALVEEHDVVAYQRAWLSDEVRADLARADQLLHARFVEHDSSGRVSGKGRTLATLRVLPAPVTVEVLGVEDLAPWVVLLRWRSRSASGNNVCASVWTKRDGRWQLRFEQRTDA